MSLHATGTLLAIEDVGIELHRSFELFACAAEVLGLEVRGCKVRMINGDLFV